MSLIHFDGFENGGTGTTEIGLLGYVVSQASAFTANGRRGDSRCLGVSYSSYYAYKNLGADHSEMVLGVAFIRNIAAAGSYAILGFSDGVPVGASVQMSVRINQLGQLSVYRGTTLLDTTTFTLGRSQYYYIELKVVFHGSTGSYDLRVGNVSRLSATGINTISTANAYANHFFLGTVSGHDSAGSAYHDSYYDDLYVLNTSGSINNDFLGDCRIDAMRPNADGTHSDFTPSTGTSHYQLVDEVLPSVSDYNYSTTIGHKDSYNVQTPPAIPDTDVYGFKHMVNMTTDIAGSRSARVLLLTNSNEYQSPSDILLNTTQKVIEATYEVNPQTLAMWTNAELAAVEIGAVVTG